MDTGDEALNKAIHAGQHKVQLLSKSFSRYLLSSLLAGAYLTIVGFVFWNIRQNYGAAPEAKFLSSLFFGVGLSTIIFTSTELFTSNNMYLTLSTLAKKTSLLDTLKLWSVCWSGNFAGAICIALLLAAAGVTATLGADHTLLTSALHKAEMPASEIFVKGIFANWIVCLAAWVNLRLKDDMARFSAIVLIVFIFLYLGFEHAIANMGTFSIALLANPAFPLDGIAHNLLWSTLGNIVGGSVGLGLTSWFLYREPEENQADSSRAGDDPVKLSTRKIANRR